MNYLQRYVYGGLLLLASSPIGTMAQTNPSRYDRQQVFSPIFFTSNGNEYRSASGAPGPKYWQNRVDYTIHATLNEPDTSIQGEVAIHYTNNSPDSLEFLWLQLDQNLFDPGSRGSCHYSRDRRPV